MSVRTAIVTDSTSDLPPELAEERRIHVVPLYVIWGEETMRDGVDLNPPTFYRMLEASGDIPKTSQASPQDFVEAFEAAREKEGADEVVCAVISQQLSGTYASAMQAREMVDFPVHVIDTRQVSGAWAMRCWPGPSGASGAERQRDRRRDPAGRRSSEDLTTVENLEYLRRGGRIGNARLLIGTALSIKPLLQIRTAWWRRWITCARGGVPWNAC